MKKYYVMMKTGAIGWGYHVHAMNQNVARNKAVKRAQQETGDKQITAENVESVQYEGFYLDQTFIQIFQD